MCVCSGKKIIFVKTVSACGMRTQKNTEAFMGGTWVGGVCGGGGGGGPNNSPTSLQVRRLSLLMTTKLFSSSVVSLDVLQSRGQFGIGMSVGSEGIKPRPKVAAGWRQTLDFCPGVHRLRPASGGMCINVQDYTCKTQHPPTSQLKHSIWAYAWEYECRRAGWKLMPVSAPKKTAGPFSNRKTRRETIQILKSRRV